jgi:hypothetical protein
MDGRKEGHHHLVRPILMHISPAQPPTYPPSRDKSLIPANAAPLSYLDLYTNAFGDSPLLVARLASNIDVYAASVTVTVPQVRAGSSYTIMRKFFPPI